MAFDAWFDGFCPQCRLDGDEIRMVDNRNREFECPTCHLRINVDFVTNAIIMLSRGAGDFRGLREAEEIPNPEGRVLCRLKPGEWGKPAGVGEFIETEDGLREYLSEIHST